MEGMQKGEEVLHPGGLVMLSLPVHPPQVVMRGLRTKLPAHAPPAYIQLAQ